MFYQFKLDNDEITHDLFMCVCNADADCENCYGKGIIAIETPEFGFECNSKDSERLLTIIKQPDSIIGILKSLKIKTNIAMLHDIDNEVSTCWRHDNNFHYSSDAARIEKLRKLIKASLYYGDDLIVLAKKDRL